MNTYFKHQISVVQYGDLVYLLCITYFVDFLKNVINVSEISKYSYKYTFTLISTEIPEPVDPQLCQALCAIMKLSFEEEYRRAMNELGVCEYIFSK